MLPDWKQQNPLDYSAVSVTFERSRVYRICNVTQETIYFPAYLVCLKYKIATTTHNDNYNKSFKYCNLWKKILERKKVT